ncbi:hypothetical protein C8R45DRAFT_933399 [Mycena sanguinolenta]|nr:hypothetical protein C8R45DRAFT_933399 [Mycena sanguinolenta]
MGRITIDQNNVSRSDGVRQIAELGLRPAIEELGQAERALTPGISSSIPPRWLGLVAGGWGERNREEARTRLWSVLFAHTKKRPGVLMADHRIVVGNLNSDSRVVDSVCAAMRVKTELQDPSHVPGTRHHSGLWRYEGLNIVVFAGKGGAICQTRLRVLD